MSGGLCTGDCSFEGFLVGNYPLIFPAKNGLIDDFIGRIPDLLYFPLMVNVHLERDRGRVLFTAKKVHYKRVAGQTKSLTPSNVSQSLISLETC